MTYSVYDASNKADDGLNANKFVLRYKILISTHTLSLFHKKKNASKMFFTQNYAKKTKERKKKPEKKRELEMKVWFQLPET